MSCSGCGSSSVIPGSRTARAATKRQLPKRVGGYAGSGVVKSEKRLLAEAKALKALNKKASKQEQS